jgi:cyanophycinase-like exopeptidase
VPDPAEVARTRGLYGADERDLEVVDAGLLTAIDARSQPVLERLAAADIIHVAGGTASRLYDATIGSPALETIARASAGGAVCIGGSAGAIIWGAGAWDDWYTGDPARKEVVPLWAWLKRVVVDAHAQHETRRQWQRQCLAALPRCIGLGIPNKAAALVLPGWEEIESLGPEPFFVLPAADAPPLTVPVGERYRVPPSLVW